MGIFLLLLRKDSWLSLPPGWKIIAIALVAIGGFCARLFRRIEKDRAIVEVPSIQNDSPTDK
jgi:hypothetical protein